MNCKNDSKKMTCLDWLGARLFYTRLYIFLYMHKWTASVVIRGIFPNNDSPQMKPVRIRILDRFHLNKRQLLFDPNNDTLKINSSKTVLFEKKKTSFTFFIRKTSKALSKSKCSWETIYSFNEIHNLKRRHLALMKQKITLITAVS
jgi:hypothetical protein